MTHKKIINTLRQIAISLAMIGLLGVSQTLSAQTKRKSASSPVIVFAPTYICDTDFSGDVENDIVFFNSATTTWVSYLSDDTVTQIEFGFRGDYPVAADYDGDNIVDIAAVHDEDGILTWQIFESSHGAARLVEWGIEGDVPVKGDYDGDGSMDIAIWRASEGTWYILTSSTGELMTILHGVESDTAMPGDYDGDGKTDAAVFRLNDHSLHFLGSLDSVVHSQYWSSTFIKGNTFVPADYDGDGITDFAIFNVVSGEWIIHQSSDDIYRIEKFVVTPSICIPLDNNPCIEDDFVFPSDYDNDGKADPAVWNSKTGEVNVIGSLNGPMVYPTTMSVEDAPVPVYFVTK